MYKSIRPLVFLQDCEDAHNRVVSFGRALQAIPPGRLLLGGVYGYENSYSCLETSICGIDFKNPVGLAAGFDKNAVMCGFIESLGFGYSEIGSVTAEGGEGNEKPRLFRLVEDEAAINRMGLNNQGACRINANLKRRRSKFPIGVNIAKTHSPEIMGDDAIEDFLKSYKIMTEGDYAVINISCPNTAEGKTFEDSLALDELLSSVQELRRYDRRPLFVKLSPDLDNEDLSKVLQVSELNNVDGYVATNTTSGRDGLVNTSAERLEEIGKGGLSGKPLRQRSTELIRIVYKETKKPIMGVGGIFTAYHAYEKILNGAVLIQVLTGMVYEGFGIVRNINEGLVRLLESSGFKTVSDAVGVAA